MLFLHTFFIPDSFSVPFHHLKSLSLLVEIHEHPLIAFLSCAPNLEDLKIYFGWSADDVWELPEDDIPGLTYHLKAVS
ncbi:hypothetical protein OWV82_000407 [Melia azedarach]|uniref:Uncharacterized protein n=1 Tax=Melia azedarach TaxID=155640 RepID=A0ACC1YUY4_MELAZ|nr:hypothetical protein OWV82_000407 [Melia azedarach]